MNYARNYQNLLNFVKVMPKILVVPFFSDTVESYTFSHKITLLEHALHGFCAIAELLIVNNDMYNMQ